MADSISYTPTTWADGADGGTPITAARLNNIESGVTNATKQANANAADIKTLGDSVSQSVQVYAPVGQIASAQVSGNEGAPVQLITVVNGTRYQVVVSAAAIYLYKGSDVIATWNKSQ